MRPLWSPFDGVSALVRRDLRASLPFLCRVRQQQEGSHLQVRKRALNQEPHQSAP